MNITKASYVFTPNVNKAWSKLLAIRGSRGFPQKLLGTGNTAAAIKFYTLSSEPDSHTYEIQIQTLPVKRPPAKTNLEGIIMSKYLPGEYAYLTIQCVDQFLFPDNMFSSRYLIHKLRVLSFLALRPLLVVEIPVVQVATSCRQIRRKAEPTQVRHQCPASYLVYLPPYICEVSDSAGQRDNINSGFYGSLEVEE